MKILFVMRHSGYVRNFESTLRTLCARGHHVHLAFQVQMRDWLFEAADVPHQLANEYPNFTYGMAPVREDGWGLLGRDLRLGLDYLRYFSPQYRDAPRLRRRAEQGVDDVILRTAQWGGMSRWALARVLRCLDHSLPRGAEIDRFMDEHRPDLLLVTPLVERGSPQSDYVRSARARRIRTVFCVASWDNLTNKGLIHERFDLMTVWNDAMKGEAVALHGVPPHRVVVTGAQPFDHWFGRQPSSSREAFCARIGLRSDRPYLLYLCSSRFIAPDEAAFVRKWVRRLRESSSGALRDVGVLVRPHPQNARQWTHFDSEDMTDFAVFPRAGASPIDAATRTDYFDSIYHSKAVVAVNTTAEIESAIIGRPVYSYLSPEFRDTQDGTLHFQHLRHGGTGLVNVAHTFADHLAQLERAVHGPGEDDGRLQKFVEWFVRPQGIGVSATSKLVSALEELGARRAPFRMPLSLSVPFVRQALKPLAEQSRRKAIAAAAERARRLEVRQANRRRLRAQRKTRRREQPSVTASAAVSEATAQLELQRRLEVIQGLQALSSVDRDRFVRDNVVRVSPELWEAIQQSQPQRLDYASTEILLRVSSRAGRSSLRTCAKDPFTVSWIERMNPGEVMYDVGAGVGSFSLIAAKKPTGAARVFSFEGNAANVSALWHNVLLNRATDHVTPLAVRLSDTSGLSAVDDQPPDSPPVITCRLDDIVPLLKLPAPHHIRLDIGESGMPVLQGATRTLGSPELKTMLVVAHRALLPSAIAGIVEAAALTLRQCFDAPSDSGDPGAWYGLFSRQPMDPIQLGANAPPALVSAEPNEPTSL